MSHIFDGTWSHYKISVLGVPPGNPTKGDDFNLSIDAHGVIDPSQSTVDGRTVQSGTATAKTIDLVAEGRHYAGKLVKTVIVDSKPVFVIVGRFGPAGAAPNKAKGKNAAANGQNEGDWVITKP